MNHREPTQVPTGYNRIGVCLALLLSFATAKTMRAMGHARPPSTPMSWAPAQGYLQLGAPALRFAEEPPPLPTGPRPESIAPLKAAAAVTGPDVVPGKPAAVPAESRPAPRAETTAGPVPAERTSPLAILPDENRPQVRPEDFLPYFQIPGAAVRLTTEPAPLPKSTATYTESPK